ncbi:MAG: maleylpyruvate isomerase N-terminal domain-containing protein [Mycobacterium sp.]|uniref:maleylpyruvate isomerase N-terminal domain-containing protein n=1 Tax=Mycobacterium sp. TaxID=1785 RepID=UPI003CB0A85B
MELAAREILSVCGTLDEDQWRLPSAATSWSVQDVVVHEACLLGDLIAAVGGEVLPDLKIEALNNIQVDEKRGWASGQVVEFFQRQLNKALGTFAPLQDEPLASVETQMLDLGAYPLHSIVDMFTFDMTTHLRYDVLKPRGPIDQHLPPLTEAVLGPSVSWLLGGLPKMQPALPQSISAPIALHLTGPAAVHFVISVVDGAISVRPQTDAAATVTSLTSDFLVWSTKRLPWEPLVTIDGDRDAAQRFLNAINLI